MQNEKDPLETAQFETHKDSNYSSAGCTQTNGHRQEENLKTKADDLQRIPKSASQKQNKTKTSQVDCKQKPTLSSSKRQRTFRNPLAPVARHRGPK